MTVLTDLAGASLPLVGAAAHKGVPEVDARAAVLTRAGVAVGRGRGTRAALPSILAGTGEIADAINTGSVVAARLVGTLVHI